MNRGGAEGEGDRGSEAGSVLTAASPVPGSTPKLRAHDLSRSRTLNRLSHAGAPHFVFKTLLRLGKSTSLFSNLGLIRHNMWLTLSKHSLLDPQLLEEPAMFTLFQFEFFFQCLSIFGTERDRA